MLLEELILKVSTLGGCGGLERTPDFLVLKEFIFNIFFFGRVSWSSDF